MGALSTTLSQLLHKNGNGEVVVIVNSGICLGTPVLPTLSGLPEVDLRESNSGWEKLRPSISRSGAPQSKRTWNR